MSTHSDSSQSNTRTRQQHKQEKKQENKQKKKRNRRSKRRIFPIWLRLIIIPLLVVAALMAGLVVGYSVIGGAPFKDVFNWDTWKHIIDIVNKK